MVWKRLVVRPVWLLSLVAGLLFVVSTGFFAGLAWRQQTQLMEVYQDIEHMTRIQRTVLDIQRHLLVPQPAASAETRSDVRALRAEIRTIRRNQWFLHPETGVRLERLSEQLTASRTSTKRPSERVLREIRSVSVAELSAQRRLLRSAREDARRQFSLGVTLVGVLLAFFLGTMVWLRWRVFRPLAALRRLLRQLAAGDRKRVEFSEVHGSVAPVLENYNRLVTALAALEAEHASQTESLEQQVKQATETLLVQQRTLARTERLAAVAETSARLAHEVRNPLAGILMAISNLQREATDEEQRQRLDPVVRELERLARLVDGYLDDVRHDPEQVERVPLAPVVSELLSLLRYQVPDRVTLVQQVPSELEVLAPPDRLRQALLNLLLNATDVVQERAGTVTVSADTSGESLSIQVCDTGPGFPDSLLQSGIQPFRHGRPGGTGLGLSLVSRLARDLGGGLHLSNLPEGGACARLELPVSP